MREGNGRDERGDGARTPRVCVCVMMNHPYPANLPLLRRVYAGRFSELLFLVPFERIDAPDVITTYRGSYVHAAYVADALHRLRTVDCDHFLFVHDDVLLNPQLDETTFDELMPLGPDDGFIARVDPTPPKLGDWEWYLSFLPRLLHPKSLVFGTGIEPGNVLRYLPDRETIRNGFLRSGAPFTEQVELDLRSADDPTSRARGAERKPSKVLLDGLAATLDHGTIAQQTVDRVAGEALQAITGALAASTGRDGVSGTTLDLPLPLAGSGFFTDCYVLPRSRLEAFAHHMGVAGAAGLFVEIIVPVLLHALCDRVHTAASLGLDFSGFERRHGLGGFVDKRKMAIHPFKFSTIRTAEQQRAFISVVADLRRGRSFDPRDAAAAGLSPAMSDAATYTGWHALERWGRWSARRHASVSFGPGWGGKARRMKLGLSAPVHPEMPDFTGTVTAGTGLPRTFAMRFPQREAEVILTDPGDPELPLRIGIESSRMVVPSEHNPASGDDRSLGVGLRRIEWL